MLGRLCKWLRIFGFDAELAGSEPDAEVVAHAKEDSLTLISRDKKMKVLYDKAVIVNGDGPAEQMMELVKALGLELPDGPVPNHCTKCNGKLECTDEGLPPNISEGWRCTKCGQAYWEGSHWQGAKEFLAKVKG